MSKEIVTWCDSHLAGDGERVAGTTWPVTLSGRSHEVDLCGECAEHFVAPLQRLLDDLGTPVKGVKGAEEPQPDRSVGKDHFPEPMPCLVKGCPYTANTRSTMRTHVERDHDGMSLNTLEARKGSTITGERIKFYCTLCEAGFTHGAGWAGHMRSRHPDEFEAGEKYATSPRKESA